MSKQAERKYRMTKYRHENIRKNVVKGLRQFGYDVDDVYLSSMLSSAYDDCNAHYAIYNMDTELFIGELSIDKDYRGTLRFDEFTLVRDGKTSDDRYNFSLKLLSIGEKTLTTI